MFESSDRSVCLFFLKLLRRLPTSDTTYRVREFFKCFFSFSKRQKKKKNKQRSVIRSKTKVLCSYTQHLASLPTTQTETCLPSLHNPDGLLSPSFMVVGGVQSWLLTRIYSWRSTFNELYANYVILQLSLWHSVKTGRGSICRLASTLVYPSFKKPHIGFCGIYCSLCISPPWKSIRDELLPEQCVKNPKSLFCWMIKRDTVPCKNIVASTFQVQCWSHVDIFENVLQLQLQTSFCCSFTVSTSVYKLTFLIIRHDKIAKAQPN